MICCQFIFKPGTYDDDFHRLDAQIDEYARALPGFDHVEKWVAPAGDVVNAMYYFADRKSVAKLARFPVHREAKGQVERWYQGYRIVVSDVRATYGDGRLEPERPPRSPRCVSGMISCQPTSGVRLGAVALIS